MWLDFLLCFLISILITDIILKRLRIWLETLEMQKHSVPIHAFIAFDWHRSLMEFSHWATMPWCVVDLWSVQARQPLGCCNFYMRLFSRMFKEDCCFPFLLFSSALPSWNRSGVWLSFPLLLVEYVCRPLYDLLFKKTAPSCPMAGPVDNCDPVKQWQCQVFCPMTTYCA